MTTARERMLAGLPGTGHRICVSGVATEVWQAGSGPALVLLHGGIECGGAMWAPVVQRLSQRHRVVVPDVPGLGESEPFDRLDSAAFDRWLPELLRRIDIDRPVVVAHSLIGGLTARYAARHGEAFGRLVIYGAPAVGPYRMPLRLRYIAVRFAMRPTPANAERFERFALHDYDATRARDPGWFDAFSEYTRARATEPHVKRTMRHLIAAQTRPVGTADLARITVPTTLLWGAADRMVPLAVASSAHTRHGWPLRVIEGAGHAPHIEAPDRFAAEIERL